MNSGTSESQDIDSETFESSIEKALTTSEVIGHTFSEKAETRLENAEHNEPRVVPQNVRRKNQGSRQRMLQRRNQEIIASFTSHKRKMKKFFNTLNTSTENRLPLRIKHKLDLAYHKMLSSPPLYPVDQSNINRTFHQLLAGLYSSSLEFTATEPYFHGSAQAAVQPSSLELDYGSSLNEKIDDTHGAGGIFVDALQDTLHDTQKEMSADDRGKRRK